MAQTKVKLDTKSNRARLPSRNGLAPYFERIGEGAYIGFRPSVRREGDKWVALGDGSGSWVARYRNDDGKQITQKLPDTDDYDVAVKAARTVCKLASRGITNTTSITVEEACRRYVKAFETTGNAATANDAQGRFSRLVYALTDQDDADDLPDDHPRRWFGKIRLHKLKREHVRDWFGFISRKPDDIPADEWDEIAAKSSANRNLDALKGALNMAVGDRLVEDAHAWDIDRHTGVKRSRSSSYLTLRQMRRLFIESGMSTEMADFSGFLGLTGMRPGAAAKLRVRDWEPNLGILTVGTDKDHNSRKITVSTNVLKTLNRVIRQSNLKPDDLIFGLTTQINVKLPGAKQATKVTKRVMWERHLWKSRFRDAVNQAIANAHKRAEQARADGDDEVLREAEADALAYEGTVLYTVRHSAITHMIIGNKGQPGLDLLTVALLTGTSVEMIQKFYGHLSRNTRKALDAIGF